MTAINVATLAELKAALATAATNNESDVITLTADIGAASGADFTSGTGGSNLLTINITDGMTLSIVGGGFTLDANHFGRVLEISSGAVAISNLTLREGSLAAAGGDHSQVGGSALGGGIYNAGALTLTGVTVTANSAAGGGGGGGGYYSAGGSGAGGGANDGSRFAGDGGSGFSNTITYPGGAASFGSGGAGGVPVGGNCYIYAASGGTTGGGHGAYYDDGHGGDGGTAAVGGGMGASGNIGGGISIGGGGGGLGQNTGWGGGATHGVGAGGASVGGIYNTGTLTLSGGSVSGNVAAGGGGGGNYDYDVYAVGGDAVGGIHNAGVLRLMDGAGAVTGNVGVGGGGGHDDGQPGVGGASSTNFSGTAALVNQAHGGGMAITGTATQGQTLTAVSTLADADGLGTLSYQWKADGADISGATASTFTLTQAEVGALVTVAASYTDGGGFAESAISSATGAVSAGPDTSVATLAELKAAIAAASIDGVANTITLTADIEATSSADFVSGTGGWDLLKINVTDGMTLTIAGGNHSLHGSFLGRVLEVTAGNVSISNLSIRYGAVTAAGGASGEAGDDALGAGIYNAGNLTLTNMLVNSNFASAGGGGGGGFYSGGGGGGGGGGGYSFDAGAAGAPIAGAGGASGPGGGIGYTPAPGAAGSAPYGGAGGAQAGYSAMSGLGGGVSGDAASEGNAVGGQGGSASDGVNLSVHGGGGGAGAGNATSGAGGVAVAGIYNTGTLTISSMGIGGNVAAGGGGGASAGDQQAAGGLAVGGLMNVGVLINNGAGIGGNAAAGGKGGVTVYTPVDGASHNDLWDATVNHAHTGGMSITGTATQGQTLTAVSTLADADGLGTLSYQWKAGGVDIVGATGSTLTLTQTQVGAAITVTASYTDGGDTDEGATSAATGAVANVNDAHTGGMSITGTVTQGQTLTAVSTLADADGLGTLSYQWKAGGVDIGGATASTFTLGQAQVGAAITVTASYTDGGQTAESATSAATGAVANVNDAPTGGMAITGTATQGQTLTAVSTLADADGLGTLSYQWKAGGVDISGATGSTYTPSQAQVGKVITVTVSYTDGGGAAESATSAPTAAVANYNDAPTGSVTVTGAAAEGQILTAGNTLADVDGLGVISYQWKAGGVDIVGATGSTFTLTSAQIGKVVTVAASYTDGWNTPESVSSAATSAVTALPAEPSPTPTPTPPPVTATVDGVPVTTTTSAAADGTQTQTIVVAPVTTGRPDSTGGQNTADIPIVTSGGVKLVTVGLPNGAGLSATGPTLPAPAGAGAPILTGAIGVAASVGDQDQMAAGGAVFLQAHTGSPLIVQTVTLSGATSGTPITLTGPSPGSGVTTALIIDTHNQAGTTLITLNDIDFAAVVGAAHITGGAGSQTVFADSATQYIVLGADDDELHAGGGDDTVGSAGGDDRVFGEAGDDYAFGGIGADTVTGGSENDWVHGNAGDDFVHGNAGNDLVYGGQGADFVYGGQGDDQVFGDLGDDLVFGDLGNDTAHGGDGDDLVHGNAGDDVVQGDAGNDLVYGGQGNDIVHGGAGDDRLWGDLGDDVLSGDLGNDTLTGGFGADTFLYAAGDGLDRIEDFLQSQGDQIRLSAGHGAYTTTQVGADTVLDFGGGQGMVLANVQLASLTSGWITG